MLRTAQLWFRGIQGPCLKRQSLISFRSLAIPISGGEPRVPTPPRVFHYDTIVKHVRPSKEIIVAVEEAFRKLSKGEVIVPFPMHIGIPEKGEFGPGDAHFKAGYQIGTETFTSKVACVSFMKNIEQGMPIGSGTFCVFDAKSGFLNGIFYENRYLTDLRTGAAGAIAVKHLTDSSQHRVAFIGTGAIATAMAEASHCVKQFEYGYAYGLDKVKCQVFANDIHNKLGYKVLVCDTAEDAVRHADVIFTQTTGHAVVLDAAWLKPKVTIIASGSDQDTKNELPVGVMKKAKFVTDLTAQCAKVGELRTALKGGMTLDRVHAELGEIIGGTKAGREESDGVVVVDLTGTGAQDAAIGQVAWNLMKDLPVGPV